MRSKDIVSLAIEALYDRKVRSILTILMVVVGSSLMVTLNGLGAAQSNFIKQQLNQLATDVVFVSPGQRNFRGGGDSSTPTITLNQAVVGKIKSLPYVEDVIAQYRGSVNLASQGNTVRVSVLAMDPQKLAMTTPSITFVAGSTVRENDPSAMLVGYSVANPAGATSPLVVIGQTVSASFSFVDSAGSQKQETKSFLVTGIMQLSGNNQIDQAVVINLAAGNSFFHKSGKFDSLSVKAQSSEYVDIVQKEIAGLYGSTIGLTTPQSLLALREQFTSGTSAFILSIGSVALIVGAVGIVATLYTSVTERIKEIGTMKAIGAQGSAILSLFLVEATLIGIMGATGGIVLGMVGGYLLSALLFSSVPGPGMSSLTPVYLIEDLVKVWALSLVLSIGAGLYPAWKASQLSPMIALRRD